MALLLSHTLARRLRSAANWNEANFDSVIQRIRDPAQHCKGVALIVGVLKAANDRRCGSDEFGKLSLGEARPGPQLENLARIFVA